MKILTIIGARPQFIKAATVSKALTKHPHVNEVIVHTGQHFDQNMSDIFFDELNIPRPAYNLSIGGGLHGQMTGAQLIEIEKVLLQEVPDWVLVYGDTNSTLAGALAATKLHIPIAHVEAGLRSFNRRMPEEINRVIVDHVSSLLLAPTDTAMVNLAREGIGSDKCIQVGDVMYDAVNMFGEHAQKYSTIMDHLGLNGSKFILVTIHRAENTDDIVRLKIIISALNMVSDAIKIVWPIHPRTRKLLLQNKLFESLGKNIILIEPVGYLDMVMLEQNTALIATDSGGIQKEAFFFKVPCVTLRDETEWLELVESGWNRLAPPQNVELLANQILGAIGSKGQQFSPYGDGNASEKIAACLVE
jgi:UDP-GlcNAc3NAcA epimerase